MKKPTISLVAVIGKNRALGYDNRLLWRLPKDMQRFRKLTLGHPVIMGRKTWESLPENYRPLPERFNIVVSRQKDYFATGATVAGSLEEALEKAKAENKQEVFIIGGAQVYKQGLAVAEKIYLTIVDDAPTADTFFPEYEKEFFQVIKEEDGVDNDFKYTFQILEK